MAKLIVIEGLDGSGKGTQSALLKKNLEDTFPGIKVKLIDFPAYGSEGSVPVRMYLDGKLGEHPDDTNAYAASSFFAIDRYISYVTSWKSDYEDPSTVIIANRYTTANAYHQISKLPDEEWDGFLEWLWDFEFGKLGLPGPDVTLLLDMPEKVSNRLVLLRSSETGRITDIHEKDYGYLAKCRKAAGYVADKYGWVVIPCAGEDSEFPYPVETISEAVFREVTDRIFRFEISSVIE